MEALILAAGYGTRLFPLTVNTSKSLITVKGRPVIEYIISRIEPLGEVDKIYIITNQRFFNDFKNWRRNFKAKKPVEILNDHTTSNKNRLGATGDLKFAVKAAGIKDELLVLGGDNLFSADLRDFVGFGLSKLPFCSIGLYDVKDLDLAKKYGVVVLDKDFKITNFEEKPKIAKSTLVAKCLYLFSKDKLEFIMEYLNSGAAKDAPGFFWEWFCKRDTVYGFKFSEPWFDIGDRALYEKAQKEFVDSV